MVNLLPGFDFPTSVAPGIGRVYAVHTRHVDPYFVLGHARDKDRAGHREVDPRLARLGDLVAKPHGDELLVAERLRRHDVHVVDVRVLCDRVAQALCGDTAHREHQRRGLHAALGIALAALDAGTEGHIGVARAVDHSAGEDRLAPGLAFDDHPLYFVVLADDVGAENIHQYLDAGLLHQLLCEGLALLRVDDRQAYVELAGSVSARGAPLLQPVDKALREPLDDLVAFLPQESQDREPDREVPAQVAAAFDQHDLQPFARCGLCGHEPRGAPADDKYVRRCAYGDVAGGFADGRNFLFHGFGFYFCTACFSCGISGRVIFQSITTAIQCRTPITRKSDGPIVLSSCPT